MDSAEGTELINMSHLRSQNECDIMQKEKSLKSMIKLCSCAHSYYILHARWNRSWFYKDWYQNDRPFYCGLLVNIMIEDKVKGTVEQEIPENFTNLVEVTSFDILRRAYQTYNVEFTTFVCTIEEEVMLVFFGENITLHTIWVSWFDVLEQKWC